MKKFQDARAPLNLIKMKLQLKARDNDGYSIFHKEIEIIVLEQNKFMDDLEFKLAVAEATDPVQACPPFHLIPHVGERGPPSEKVLLCSSPMLIHTYIYNYTYTCTQTSAHL